MAQRKPKFSDETLEEPPAHKLKVLHGNRMLKMGKGELPGDIAERLLKQKNNGVDIGQAWNNALGFS